MVTISEQAILFLTCVKMGIIMGILYDFIRIFRKTIKHPNWLVQVEDLIYWIACGCFAFVMIYWRNYGQIRSFVFLGIVIGATLYFATVSILILKIITKVIDRILSIVLIPIKCIISITRKYKTKFKSQLKIIKEKK